MTEKKSARLIFNKMSGFDEGDEYPDEYPDYPEIFNEGKSENFTKTDYKIFSSWPVDGFVSS